ncbi:MAG: group II intron reverse transcriptase/maturase [Deltaproteobacteria bacterium]|nr:MAG: group II intron reverse transcriptase/maturase [Deltaproteobacteria bacterium]
MKDAEPEKKIEISEADQRGQGRKPEAAQASGSNFPGHKEPAGPKEPDLIERMLERGNMLKALQAVEANQGAAGVDGMEVSQLRKYLRGHWAEIKEQILNGNYEPRAVRRVDIPKPGGGTRMLGIPTVLDRLIQQAIHQILSPLWEEGFSPHSYGFRPGRSAGQAVKAAQGHIQSGKRWVVDMDLEKFFDRVNHDVLMARVARKVKDRHMLKLIRRYLESGIMQHGLVEPRSEGTPQGGPLSPLLSNILLDDLDKELEKRRHRFCRYADDCNIYVGSQRAGERVMESLPRFLKEKLKLTVNPKKSAVDRPWRRKFLGFSMTAHRECRVRVAPQSVERFKEAMRQKFREGRGRNLRAFLESLKPKLRGWASYFSVAETRNVFEDLDQWLRRKLRCMEWRKWKKPRTRMRKLIALGLDRGHARESAFNGRGPWWNAGASHMNAVLPTAYFRRMGLISVLEGVNRFTWLRKQRSL